MILGYNIFNKYSPYLIVFFFFIFLNCLNYGSLFRYRIGDMRPATVKKLKTLAFLAISLVLIFSLVEILARVINLPARPSDKSASTNNDSNSIDDPQLFWRLKPNIRYKEETVWVKTNNLGLRDDDVAIPKPKNCLRVLCLGESTTYGANVPQDQTYANVAEKKLNETGSAGVHYEVINAGLSASTSFQGWQWVKRYGKELKPDVIALYYKNNDLMPRFIRPLFLRNGGFDYSDRELYKIRNKYAGLLYLFEHSMLYKSLRHIITGQMAIDNKLRLSAYVKRGNKLHAAWPVRVPNGDRKWVWQQFKKWCYENQCQLVIMFPCYITSQEGPSMDERWAGSNGVHFIDCVSLLKKSGIPWSELYKVKIDNHPSPVAHHVIGIKLAEELKSLLHKKTTKSD